MSERVTRRTFFKGAALSAAAISASAIAPDTGLGTGFGAESVSAMIPYQPRLSDRLWMWGHGAGSTDSLYKIPKGNGIDEADAIRSMGIPNLCVIRWRGLPQPENADDPAKPPFERFCRTLTDVKRIAWSLVDGAPEPYERKKRWVFDLAASMPNFTTLFLDDFFIDKPHLSPGKTEPAAHLSLDALRQLRDEMATLPRRPDLAAVLYAYQLDESIRQHLELCDVVSFWTWHATDLAALESNFRRYREILPNKRTLLGIYMWDFGNMRPVTPELMTHQLDFALDLFKRGEIEGMIFHCTPLCDIGLDAVERSRRWIRENGEITAS